jgi:hypothetical protein
VIAETRSSIAEHLRTTPSLAGVTVLDQMPDDLNDVPCLVVGRPSIAPGRESQVDEVETVVFVVGRRLSDSGAQPELDALADAVYAAAFARIVGLPGIGSIEVRADPNTTAIAGVEHPVYLVSLTTVAPRPCGD